MAAEKIDKMVQWALNGVDVDNLDLTQVKAFWETQTGLVWDFAGDSFDTLGLPGLKLRPEAKSEYADLIHQAAVAFLEKGR